MFIYKITNLANKKVYIGQTLNIKVRVDNGHKDKLRTNTHQNKHLQASYNKYGKDAFEFEVILECSDIKMLDQEETRLIKEFDSTNPKKGYNRQFGGHIGNRGLRAWNKGLTKTQQPRYGKKLSLKTYIRRTLKKVSEIEIDIRPKIIDRPENKQSEKFEPWNKGLSTEKQPMFGKNHSETTKLLMAKKAQARTDIKGQCGYRGVIFDKRCPKKPYYAVVNFGRGIKRKYLGYFKTAEEASNAYIEYTNKLDGIGVYAF